MIRVAHGIHATSCFKRDFCCSGTSRSCRTIPKCISTSDWARQGLKCFALTSGFQVTICSVEIFMLETRRSHKHRDTSWMENSDCAINPRKWIVSVQMPFKILPDKIDRVHTTACMNMMALTASYGHVSSLADSRQNHSWTLPYDRFGAAKYTEGCNVKPTAGRTTIISSFS
jgi:hypothetical protein